jgi:hypothetical protein
MTSGNPAGGHDGGLVLGPLVRYVDHDSATVWVETARAETVTVRIDERSWSARTFAVHGHHYALVEVVDLEPGSVSPYTVALGPVEHERQVWPPRSTELELPPSVISTLRRDRPPRIAFGSCRTSVAHDRKGNRTHGVDAMRAYALAMAGVTEPDQSLQWPDLIVFLGDQVYADETSEAMQEFIASRRDIDEPPGRELKDYEEYAHLYLLAWSDPANRWLLSTLPSTMIFDDHDIRDDWNTSFAWREQMEQTDWWHGRIVAGLASYWVYQHLGNLSAEERAADEIWQRVAAHEGEEELDLGEVLDRFADRVDQQPDSYRWSYSRELNGSRLVVVDSRAARVLERDERQMLDDGEMSWLDEQLSGDVDHLFIGTSLPFLLPPGLQHLESFSEALAGGAWGRRARRVGEFLRQAVDLEHWGAFQESFRRVAEMVVQVASGERGRPPRTVTFLSGDVHHSYVSQVTRLHRRDRRRLRSRVVQVVCSPIRNPLPHWMRFLTAALAYGIAGVVGAVAARSTHVPSPPFRWKNLRGPWFDNNLATAEVTESALLLWWARGEVSGGRHDRPQLARVAEVRIDDPGSGDAVRPSARRRWRRRSGEH